MQQASFSFVNYRFPKVCIDLDGLGQNAELEVVFAPSGIFHQRACEYDLSFSFKAVSDGKTCVEIGCESKFRFDGVNSADEIPDYFYPNSIAIVFPYVRAFISSVTLLANIKPMVLPTYNLSSLKDTLKLNTTFEND